MAKLNNAHRLVCGTLVLLLVDVIWVASSELTKYIFKDENFSKPFFSTYVKTTMFMLYLLGFIFWKPWRSQCSSKPMYALVDPTSSEIEENDCDYVEAEPLLSESVFIPIKYHDGGDKSSGNESDDSSSKQSVKSVHFNQVTEVRHLSESQADDALLARLSYAASLRAQESAFRAANKLPMKQVARIALLFCILWFLGNLSYQEALSNTEAGIVNILSCSSGLFTLILASIFPANSGDRFTLSKFLAVAMSIVGVSIISSEGVQNFFPPGAVWSILGAFFYAAYVVLLRRKVDSEEMLDIPMFFGFVGLFNLLLMWPGFIFLHYTKVEEFQWPSQHQWLLLLCNGLIGTVFSELLWLWGCFLTSSLIATLSVSLTIPFTIFFDIFLKKKTLTSVYYGEKAYLLKYGYTDMVNELISDMGESDDSFSKQLAIFLVILIRTFYQRLSVNLLLPVKDFGTPLVDYPLPFFLGTMPMFLSFFAVAFLTHYENWDPVLVGVNKLVNLCFRKTQRVRDIDYEQTESLINVNSEYT